VPSVIECPGFGPTSVREGTERPELAYDGPALVELSEERQLVLVYDVPSSGSATTPQRSTISVPSDAPTLQVIAIGTRLWFQRDPLIVAPNTGWSSGQHEDSWSFTLRTEEAGKILLGAAFAAYVPNRTPTWPLPLLSVSSVARCRSQALGHWLTTFPIDVQADEQATLMAWDLPIRIDGIDYLANGYRHVADPNDGCQDCQRSESVHVNVRALDIAGLTRDLPRQVLPGP
jgi:hypothetical protein